MATGVRPFLMFQGRAEEAMNFYVSLLPESEVLDIVRYGPEGPGAQGSVLRAAFRLKNQTVLCIDSPVKHGFDFTPSFSFWVDCDSDGEIGRLTGALTEDRAPLMPLADHGFSRRFAWVRDRYGVSWQLNLA